MPHRKALVAAFLSVAALAAFCPLPTKAEEPPMERTLEIRGIYGGVPTQIFEHGQTLADYGINAVWIGSASLDAAQIAQLHRQGAKVFAEFNTLHDASFLKQHPDAAPVGSDGQVCPPPDGWQGVCPTHPAYRQARMQAFRKALATFEIDGIWLDYHHAMASWEQAIPNLPDTCFCKRCIEQFERKTGTSLPNGSIAEQARALLGKEKQTWITWRCGVFTDWVCEFRAIRDEVRPSALLGTFHCPWSETDFDGALRAKLAIDLKAQARYFDVLSPMPYHARFGHAREPAWIAHQTNWLGHYLGVAGRPDDRVKIWPIVQLSEWGEPVPLEQVVEVLDFGTRPPATGLTVFVWGKLQENWDKVEAMGNFYRERTAR
jgi:hypothetical protein